MSEEAPRTTFDVVGEDGVARLVAGFYARVPDDDILAPMYPPDDMEGAEERLRDFLVYRFGGPRRYIEERGHPRLRMRHAPFAIDRVARDRWMQHMDASLDECGFDSRVADAIRAFLDDVATFLINRPG
jgi:hemoglobin